MTRKIVNKGSVGAADEFATDDIDYINKYLTGVDQSTTDPADIATDTKYRYEKLRVANSANTFVAKWRYAGTADRFLTIPDFGSTSDTVVTLAHTQTLTNKTLTTPTIASITNSGTVTIPTGTDTLVNLAGTQTLSGKSMSGGSNTFTAIPKSAIPSTTVYTDQNNVFGAFYQDFTAISAPANPGSSSVVRLFVNSATGELSVRKSGGTTVSLEATGGSGSWDPAAVETLTNKTIAFANNTLTNVASTNTAQTFSAVKTFSSAPVISTITNTGTLTLPTSTDTLVGRDTTDTLTNKTLTSPVISSISNSGTVTIPTGTDTLVNLAGTQTLTGKTISGASNTLSNIGKSAIPAATLYNDVDNVLGSHYAELTEITTPSNPASGSVRLYMNSATHRFSSLKSDGTINTLWNPAETETLTNKTISAASNTLTGVATLTGTETLTNKTLTSPTVNSPTLTNSGNTLTLPTTTDTLVGRVTTDTLTNKTLTTPTIASVLSGSGTFTHNTSGTITVPNVTGTLATLAGTETLTAKTIDPASNIIPAVQTSMDLRILGGWSGASSTTGYGFTAGVIASTAPTTNAVTNSATDGKYRTLASGSVAGNVAGHKINLDQGAVFRSIKPRFKARFRCTDVTSCRIFVGLTNQGGTGGSGTYSTGDDPFGAPLYGIALQYRSSTDTNFQIGRNDNSGGTAFVDTGVTPASNSGIHTIEIKTDNIGSASAATGFMWSLDGSAFSSVLTSDIPAAGTALYGQVNIETSTTSSRAIDIWYWFVEAQTVAV